MYARIYHRTFQHADGHRQSDGMHSAVHYPVRPALDVMLPWNQQRHLKLDLAFTRSAVDDGCPILILPVDGRGRVGSHGAVDDLVLTIHGARRSDDRIRKFWIERYNNGLRNDKSISGDIRFDSVSSSVRVMVCRWSGAKPVSKPILACYHFALWKKICKSRCDYFESTKWIWILKTYFQAYYSDWYLKHFIKWIWLLIPAQSQLILDRGTKEISSWNHRHHNIRQLSNPRLKPECRQKSSSSVR